MKKLLAVLAFLILFSSVTNAQTYVGLEWDDSLTAQGYVMGPGGELLSVETWTFNILVVQPGKMWSLMGNGSQYSDSGTAQLVFYKALLSGFDNSQSASIVVNFSQTVHHDTMNPSDYWKIKGVTSGTLPAYSDSVNLDEMDLTLTDI